MVQVCGISLEFWIRTAQTLELCALYYTKVISISFETLCCLCVSIDRSVFRESNDRKTNCSVSTETHALTLRSVSACSLFPLLSVLYQTTLPILLILLFLIFLIIKKNEKQRNK